jgi:hypothetical protein
MLADLHVLSFLKYLDFLGRGAHLSACSTRRLYLKNVGPSDDFSPPPLLRKDQSCDFLEEAQNIFVKLQFKF